MARSTKQIQQELDKIKETVTTSAQELQTLYDRYLASLSESAQKQLIFASYQLCTQIYPEIFVAMPYAQRQKLQQALRELSRKIAPLLAERPTAEDLSQEQTDLSLIAEMLKKLPLERSAKSNQEPETSELPEVARDRSDREDIEEPEEATAAMVTEVNEDRDGELIVEEIQELSLEKLQNLADRELDTPKIKEIDLSNPHHVILWHQKIESQIRKTLDDTSRQVNKYLQEFEIIPSRLPSKVMDIALQAGEGNSGGKSPKIPNILNLVIETEKKQKKQKINATQISLVRLRLSEIEFADARLSGQKNEIRLLIKKVKKLRDLYRAKEHEFAIAEADAAWRSSWYED